MSSPFLDLAIGALRGSKANRQERIEAEERRRRQQREDTEQRLRLAELAANPEFEVGQFPFVDAAAQAGAPEIVPPPGAPAPPRTGPRGPMLEEEEPPAAGGGLGAGAGPAAAAIAPPRPGAAAAPPAPGGAATPFLDQALDLGEVEVGGTKYGVRAHPGRNRQRAETNNRAAYEALHQADPEAYPTYIEGMPEGYYAEELSDYAQGIRAGRIEDRRARREGRTAEARAAVARRRDTARDEVFSLAQEGKSFEEVVAAISADHELRGVLTRSEIRREMQSAGQINAPARDVARRISTLKTQLGRPPTPNQGGAAVSAQDQQEIIEALAEGATAEQILEVYQGHPAQRTVERWLRRGRQYRAPPLTP